MFYYDNYYILIIICFVPIFLKYKLQVVTIRINNNNYLSIYQNAPLRNYIYI